MNSPEAESIIKNYEGECISSLLFEFSGMILSLSPEEIDGLIDGEIETLTTKIMDIKGKQ